MMKTIILMLFLLVLTSLSYGQELNSRGDKSFYSYAYKNAISEYQTDISKGNRLTNLQFLNLAEAYFRIGDFKNASKIYLDVYKKSDTIIKDNRLNIMLQSLSKTTTREKVKAFMNLKRESLSSELLENAEFNTQLLDIDENKISDTKIFNAGGNSTQADFSPSFYNEKLLFSSSRPQKEKKIYAPSGESYLDIYVARIASDGKILNPNVFTDMPKSKYHKSTPQYFKERNQIFYTLSNTENEEMAFNDEGKNALAIGMVNNDGFFRFLLRDLSTSFYYPYFQAGSDKLYFSADFNGGYGGTDIYYVYTNNGQIMSEPINLGPRINSPGNEIAPYIYNESLYFSSDIFYGFGGMDVYKSNMQPDEIYSLPVNLGSGINSEADDFGFIIKAGDEKGLVGYFASNRPGGKGKDDIYGFVLNTPPGLKTFALKGRVFNSTSEVGVVDAQVSLLNKSGELIKELYTNSEGNFQLEIPWQDQLTIQCKKEGYSTYSITYSGDTLEELQKHSYNMTITALADLVSVAEGKTVLDIKQFFFAKNKSYLIPSIKAELDKVITAISNFPQLKIKIESHTSSKGSEYNNKKLSQKRAEVIKKYLLANGVPAENILDAVGYGEDRILNKCTNGVYCLDFLHKQNIRTLFVIANYAELE